MNPFVARFDEQVSVEALDKELAPLPMISPVALLQFWISQSKDPVLLNAVSFCASKLEVQAPRHSIEMMRPTFPVFMDATPFSPHGEVDVQEPS
jgi:hypothetical protein